MARLADEFLTTHELAELLHIKERKVYDLVASGEIPHSRATGKLLFSRSAVNDWVAGKSSGSTVATQEPLAERLNVFLGSHDPLLDWALRESGSGLATFFDGSGDGLKRFARREGIATALHCYNSESDVWNIPAAERFADEAVVLVEFGWRERGLIVAGNNRLGLSDIASLKEHRVVPRQLGAGSQILLEQLLAKADLSLDDIRLTEPARTETDAAIAVLEDRADATFGLLGVANQLQLDFLPIMRERFDLLVDRRAWFEPAMQSFIHFCQTEAFSRKAEALSGYDVAGFGNVHFNGQ